jgi:hypothetical protein
VFWKTSWNIVLPAPLLAPVVVVRRRLVAHAGRVPPAAERGPEVDDGAAPPEVPEPEESLGADAEPDVPVGVTDGDVADGADGVDGVDEAETEDDDAAFDASSFDPHAASASPAPTSSTAAPPRRTFLIRMVALFPECSQ